MIWVRIPRGVRACNLNGRMLVLHIKYAGSIPARSKTPPHVAELVIAAVLKAVILKDIWVQVPSCAEIIKIRGIV